MANWPMIPIPEPRSMPPTISAISYYVPPTARSNRELAARFNTTEEWIVERTGICERRIAASGGTSDLIVPAALDCLAQAGITADSIDCIIVATITPDRITPSTAAIVQRKIGAINSWGFDISAACSGFLYGLVTASQFIQSNAGKRILVCAADRLSCITDPRDRRTAVLLGDGAGVALVEMSDDPALGILDYLCWMDGNGESAILVPAGGSQEPVTHETLSHREHFLRMEGKIVANAAIEGMSKITRELMGRNRLTNGDLAWYVPHQANLRILEAVAERLGLPMNRVMVNVEKYGNTSAASIPICLSEWSRAGRLSRGDTLVMSSIGAGYVLGSVLLRWSIGNRT